MLKRILASLVIVAAIMAIVPAYAEEKKEEGKEEKHAEYEYMELKPLILPIITDRGLTQQVSLLVSLELPYGTKDDIKEMSPRLADAYLQDLYGVLGSGGALMQGTVIDVQAIKQRLTSVTTKVLGQDKFHEVLLQVVQQRPM